MPIKNSLQFVIVLQIPIILPKLEIHRRKGTVIIWVIHGILRLLVLNYVTVYTRMQLISVPTAIRFVQLQIRYKINVLTFVIFNCCVTHNVNGRNDRRHFLQKQKQSKEQTVRFQRPVTADKLVHTRSIHIPNKNTNV